MAKKTAPKKIADMRMDYRKSTLERNDLSTSPYKQFTRWFDLACQAGVPEPNAMTLCTASVKGKPTARIVLLKEFTKEGLSFFTNYESRKGNDLKVNPQATVVFHWHALQQQIIVEGRIKKLSRKESNAYFQVRPRASQLGAWASQQSRAAATRDELENAYTEVEQKYEGKDVPIPPHWGGYLLVPKRWEFWQGRSGRMHDRFEYSPVRGSSRWKIQRLYP